MHRGETWRYVAGPLMFATVWAVAGDEAVGDWSTYRGDSHRSGVTAESLKLPLVESWRMDARHPPQPAWPELPARLDVYRDLQLGPARRLRRRRAGGAGGGAPGAPGGGGAPGSPPGSISAGGARGGPPPSSPPGGPAIEDD